MYGLFEPNRRNLSWKPPTDSHWWSNMVCFGTNLSHTTSQAAAHIAGYGRCPFDDSEERALPDGMRPLFNATGKSQVRSYGVVACDSAA
jgi:hypothetical protein